MHLRPAVPRKPRTRWSGRLGCCLVGLAVLGGSGSASANVDPFLDLDQFSTLWTGRIHHVRTDDLSQQGGPGDFQKWDTTITTTPKGTVADSTYSSVTTFRQSCNGTDSTYTSIGAGHYTGPLRDVPGANGRMRIRVAYGDGENRVFFTVPNMLVTETSNSPCSPSTSRLYGSDSDHPGGLGFDDEDFGGIGGGSGITKVSFHRSYRLNQTTWDNTANLSMCGEPSDGYAWVDHGPFTRHLGARFPGSSRVKDLSEPFRAHVRAFFRALSWAKRGKRHSVHARRHPVVPSIAATFRSDERAWLMNTAYRVAGGWQRFRPGKPPGSARSKANLAAEAPADVKPYPHGGVEQVPICWLHQDRNGNPDVKASKRAAEKMKGKTGFGIADFGAAYPSNHSKGKAIDMDFSWPTITMRDGNGHSRTIPSGNSRSSHKMWAVGASFGVIKQQTGDPPHWSLNGR